MAIEIATLAKTRGTLLELRKKRERLERAIPILELKQKQLTIECTKLKREIGSLRRKIEEKVKSLSLEALVLVNKDPVKLITTRKVVLVPGVIGGVRVKLFKDVIFEEAPYSLIGTTPFFDQVLSTVTDIKKLHYNVKVLEEAFRVLAVELRKVTQRINLFDKKLIPELLEAEFYLYERLGDKERETTVIAKVAKGKYSGTTGGALLVEVV
jgi:V/A-type H+-transporting ATPase subunit D